VLPHFDPDTEIALRCLTIAERVLEAAYRHAGKGGE